MIGTRKTTTATVHFEKLQGRNPKFRISYNESHPWEKDRKVVEYDTVITESEYLRKKNISVQASTNQ